MTFARWEDVAAFALTLPATEASTSYGQPAVRTRGRLICSTGHEPGSFHVAASHADKAVLIGTDPDTFWQTPHYANWPGVLVRYGSPDPDRIRIVLTRAWWDRATKKLQARMAPAPDRSTPPDRFIRPDRFTRFVAIDWSGAKGSRHRGIAVAECHAGAAAPRLVAPPTGTIWSRTAVLDWLLDHRDEPLLAGFDFSFSAPFVARGAHLPGETTTADARALWAYVDRHSDDVDLGAASFLEARRGRHFYLGAADGTKRDFLHWRVCEQADGATKPSTVYDAIGAAQVAKASFAGMRLLHHLDGRVPVWPFDPLPATGASVIEIYTAIAARATGLPRGRSKLRDAAALDTALAALGSAPHEPLASYTDHATDALMTAAWLRRAVSRHDLWHPPALTPQVATTEGWTFGVP